MSENTRLPQHRPASEDLGAPLRQAVEQMRDKPMPEQAMHRALERARGLDTVRDVVATGLFSSMHRALGRAQNLHQREPAVRGRWVKQLLAAASLAALVLTGFLLWNGGRAVAWAQVAQAVRSKPWVHITAKLADGKTMEMWASPEHQIYARRTDGNVEYHDRRLRTYWSYDPQEEVVYRLPERRHRKNPVAEQLGETLRTLFDEEATFVSPFPNAELVEQKQRKAKIDGKTWLEYELLVRRRKAPKTSSRMVFRVDPQTRLPYSMKLTVLNQQPPRTMELNYDYPNEGPADIYALGVPRSAELVDRVPQGELARLLEGMKATRQRFGDYHAVVTWSTEGVDFSVDDNLRAWRVWRKGNKWRMEQALQALPGLQTPPKGTDMQTWWTENGDRFVYCPVQICDGNAVYHYRLKDDEIKPDEIIDPEVELQATIPVYEGEDDPVPNSEFFMPEVLGHPHVWQPTDKRRFTVEDDPLGPPETVLLVVRQTDETKKEWPDLYRLWIDEDRSYLAIQSENAVFKRSQGDKRGKQFAYLNTHVIEDVKKSPRGHWYPTVVRRTTSNSDVEQIYRYYLDFDAELPDRLFDPID